MSYEIKQVLDTKIWVFLMGIKSNLAKLSRHFLPFVDQALVSGGNFLTISIASHALSLNDAGKLGLLFSIYVASGVLGGSFLYQWANVIAPQLDLSPRYYYVLLVLQVAGGVVYAALTVGILAFFRKELGWNLSLISAAMLMLFLFLQPLVDFARATGYIFVNVNHAIAISALVYIPRIVVLWAQYPGYFEQVLGILVISTLAPLIYFGLFVKRHHCIVKPSGDEFRDLLKVHWQGTRVLAGAGPLAWISAVSPRFILGYFHGLVPVASLVGLNSISKFTNILLGVLETSVAAISARLYKLNRVRYKQYISVAFVGGMAIWALVWIGLMTSNKMIVHVVLGEKYQTVAFLLPVLWLESGFRLSFRFLDLHARNSGRPEWQLKGFVVHIGALILLGVPMIWKFGLIGAILAMVLGTFVNAATVATGLWYTNTKKQKIDWLASAKEL